MVKKTKAKGNAKAGARKPTAPSICGRGGNSTVAAAKLALAAATVTMISRRTLLDTEGHYPLTRTVRSLAWARLPTLYGRSSRNRKEEQGR